MSLTVRQRPNDPLVSVVVPVLNEERCVPELERRLTEVFRELAARREVIFVDDGSDDRTPEILTRLSDADPSIKAVRLSRSFGHQSALIAGLAHATGDLVITMDGDLQHPPELIPTLLDQWRRGMDIVHTLRRDPQNRNGFFKRVTAALFYRLMDLMTVVPTIHGGADFRLLDRHVLDQLNQLSEHFIFLRGLIPWMGYSSSVIEYTVEARFAGKSKYNLWMMLRLAIDGVFSFSVRPLRVITAMGIGTTVVGLAYGMFIAYSFFSGKALVSGWASLVMVVLIFSGIQLTSIGIVSEYIGRIYEEVKRRPRYIVDSAIGFGPPASPGETRDGLHSS